MDMAMRSTCEYPCVLQLEPNELAANGMSAFVPSTPSGLGLANPRPELAIRHASRWVWRARNHLFGSAGLSYRGSLLPRVNLERAVSGTFGEEYMDAAVVEQQNVAAAGAADRQMM
jgi:hypothetical protein